MHTQVTEATQISGQMNTLNCHCYALTQLQQVGLTKKRSCLLSYSIFSSKKNMCSVKILRKKTS